jgi:hypothetical protein
MKPASTRTTLAYHLKALRIQMTVMWWDFLDFVELIWTRNVAARDPGDLQWSEMEELKKKAEAWGALHVAGRTLEEIAENVTHDPRFFARKERIA